ncbi:NAD(P)/FAD-dependent oxidoreductase [Halomonas sp. TRM85114]|uniref:NAD(P)/FAD-dependent oxidoreductase n=1 Tax=Halomonas jincaotanensis TaxID=2810616 RepID=UPI001BD3E707|nr:NAD(P)/FAD-dependent oxidoreductase [Halomonas jincaotanensis]MBS9404592.1 NAD(P)/FAD-dependent oxidoreductase [Halomonas jincaotanensis]
MSLASLPRDWDVVVVGAGIAGAVSAFRLARRGCRVLLVEKAAWPRDKPCGGCLNAATLQGFRDLGLADIELAGAVYHRLHLACGKRQAELALPAGRAVSRRRLDGLLVDQAVAQGVHFLSATRASLEPPCGHGRERIVQGRERIGEGHERIDDGRRSVWLAAAGEQARVAARLVVASDGLGSRLLRDVAPGDMHVDAEARIGLGTIVRGAGVHSSKIEAPAAYPPGAIHMACGAPGYVGLVRVENEALNIGAALDPHWVKLQGGPGPAVAALLTQTRLPSPGALHECVWQGTPRLTRRRTRLGGERVLVLGDAAGYVEPFTGEGMGWALASAAALEPLALEAVSAWHDNIVSRWTTRHGKLLYARQRGCHGVAAMLRRPRLVSALLPILHAAPGLAAPFTAWLHQGYFKGYFNHDDRWLEPREAK